MLLTAEQLKGKPALACEDFHVQELGGEVRLRKWSGADYDEFAAAIKDFKHDGAMYSAAIAVSAVTESGERVFDTNGDIKGISAAWSKTTLENAYVVIRRMNVLGTQGLENAEKN